MRTASKCLQPTRNRITPRLFSLAPIGGKGTRARTPLRRGVSSQLAKLLRIALLAFILISASGCLKFGKDQEFLAPKVTAAHLQQVSTLTGINFPTGTAGVAYLYIGSGIDDSLALKVMVPPDQKETFLKSDAFLKGAAEPPHLQIGRSRAWWHLDKLKDAVHRKLELPKGRFVEFSLGLEDGKLVAYISWIST